MLEEADTYVKDIINHIEKSGLSENAIFILDTDHGVSLGDKFGEKMYGSYLYGYTLITFLIFYQKDYFQTTGLTYSPLKQTFYNAPQLPI